MIYIWIPCLSEWLVALILFLKREDIIRRFSMGFYALITLFEKIRKRKEKKGENHWCNLEISAGDFSKLSSTILAQTQMH